MTKTIRQTFRQYLPGGGRDILGNPKQGKTRVSGSINVTSYAGGEGEPLSALDLSLTTIDALTLRVADEASGAMTGTVPPIRQVVYTKSTAHFYLFTIDEEGDLLGMEAASTEVVEYIAEGDSAYDVELQ